MNIFTDINKNILDDEDMVDVADSVAEARIGVLTRPELDAHLRANNYQFEMSVAELESGNCPEHMLKEAKDVRDAIWLLLRGCPESSQETQPRSH